MHRAKRQKKLATHPLGVRPSGNAILEVENEQMHRIKSLGLLGMLSDELLMVVLQEMDKQSLVNLGHTCKSLYAYTWFDELWKHIVYQEARLATGDLINGLQWTGSWRKTALRIPADQDSKIDAEGLVYSDMLHRPYELSQIDYESIIDLGLGGEHSQIPVLDEKDVTVVKFDSDLHKRPFIVNLERPIANWSIEDLVSQFGNETFRQEFMDWPLKVYTEYVKHNQDETPLYLFDCRSKAHAKLTYEIPLSEIFGPDRDYFTLFGDKRPDHKWLIVGPSRSGSTFHKDPNGTSAWNSVISGRKYWIMFPPTLPPPGVWTDAEQSEVISPVSLAEWFASGLYKAATQSPGFMHGVIDRGQVMYVPSGWWHAVVNLETSIAMTGNFVAKPHLAHVLKFLERKADQISGFKDNDGDVYKLFVGLLQEHDPEVLAEKIVKPSKPSWKGVTSSTEQPFAFGFSA